MHAATVPKLKGIGALHSMEPLNGLDVPRIVGQWLECQNKIAAHNLMRLDTVYMFGRCQVLDASFVNLFLDNESLPVVQSSTGSPRRITTEYEYADDTTTISTSFADYVHRGFWEKATSILERIDQWLLDSTGAGGLTFVAIGPISSLLCCIAIGFKIRHPTIDVGVYCFGGLPFTDSDGWNAIQSLVNLKWILAATTKLVDEIPLAKYQLLEPPADPIALHRGKLYHYSSDPIEGMGHNVANLLAYSGLTPSEVSRYLQQWADDHPSSPRIPMRYRYSSVVECANRMYVSECYSQL